MQKCFFPPFLPDGGCVALVAPSRRGTSSYINDYKAIIEKHGYSVKVSNKVYKKDGILAGTDETRAEALMEAFRDPAVDAIFCLRGGTGANLILDLLDFDVIKQNPKPLVGYSDVTALINAITVRTGMVTFHGPMASNFSPSRRNKETEDSLFDMVAVSALPKTIKIVGVDVMREGSVSGRLVGGNIAILETLIGTDYDWSGAGAILFIEEVNEPLYKIERMLSHLRQAGKFEGVRAVLVGEMMDITDWQTHLDPEEHEVYGRALKDFVLKHIPSGIPVAFEVPCGHGDPLFTFPVGANVKVTIKENRCEVAVCS